MEGYIFDIQRFSLHDGPGIRTTVFLKGCPLRCAWCHNPESFTSAPQLSFASKKCTHCVQCASVCAAGVHRIKTTGTHKTHQVHLHACAACGACATICPTDALKIIGRKTTAQAVIEEATRDRVYYDESGGGITFSGGEATFQPTFLSELLALAKKEDLHTCLDTSGHVDTATFESLLPNIDLVLYDFKLADPKAHKRYTGVDNSLILTNLAMLASKNKPVILRSPIVPGVNSTNEHLRALEALQLKHKNITQIETLPYHAIGAEKWAQIGERKQPYKEPPHENTDNNRKPPPKRSTI